MKRPLALLAMTSLLSGVGITAAHADLMASLNATWDSPAEEMWSGDVAVMNLEWDANYAHGFLDDAEPTSTTFRVTAESGTMVSLPEQCAEGSTLSPTVLECILTTPDDDGVAGMLPVPVRAWGANGDMLSLTATDPHGNVAKTPELAIVAESGIDVSLAPSGLTANDYMFDETVDAVTTVPIMVSVPIGGEPLVGDVTIRLRLDTMSGPDISEQHRLLEIAPVGTGGAVTGVAANRANYEAPEVAFSLTEDILTLTFPVTDVIAPSADGAGNVLDTVPVASFGLRFTYPVHSPQLENDAMSWSAEVVSVEAATESGQLTEQIRTTNDLSVTSFVSDGSVSARFVNGHAPSAGGILAEPGDDPEALPSVHRDVWDPEQGTGTLSAGANNWQGRGPILPGDQMVGIVNAAHYLGHGPADYTEGTTHGYCLIFDREGGTTSYNGRYSVTQLSDYTLEYLDGPIPGGFANPDCGQGDWSTSEVADPTAIRILFDPARQDADFTARPILGAGYLAAEELVDGQRAWMAGGHSLDITSGWNMTGSPIAEAPGHGSTTTFRDAVEVVPSRTSVGLTASRDTVSRGQEITWTVNTRVSAAPFNDRGTDDVAHRLTLPAGVEYVDSAVNPTITEEHGRQVLTWTSGIEIGSPLDTEIVTVHRTGTGALTAQVTVENQTSTRLRTDSDTASVAALASSGAYLAKMSESSEFALDGSNRWTVTLENRDAQALTLADTIDILPYEGDGRGTVSSANVTITTIEGAEIWVSTADPATLSPDPSAESNGAPGSPSASWEEWDGQGDISAVRWISRDLGPGQVATYSIDYSVAGATNGDLLVNSAQTRTVGATTTMINSSASTTVGPPADLQVHKRLVGDGSALVAGEELTFEIQVKGSGPGTVRGASLLDIPVAGLADIEYVSLSQGSVDDGVWRIGDLPEGQIAVATVTGTATGGPVENMVVADTCEDCTPVPPPTCVPNVDVDSDTDRCDIVELTETPVLKVGKSFDGALPTSGPVSFTITVANDVEPEDGIITAASAVTATDLPGLGLDPDTIVWSDMTQGDAQGASWMIGTLRAGDQVTATVTGDVLPDAQRVVNAVSVHNPVLPRELTDPFDAIPNETVLEDTDQADVVDISREGRLAINKELVSLERNDLTFVIEVGNLGGEPIAGVVVSELPDEHLTDVEMSDPTTGELEGLTWFVGDLAPGQVETVTVTARAERGIDTVTNRAFTEADDHPHEGTFEPNPTLETDTDRGDTVTVEIPQPDLRIDKRISSIDATTAVFEIEVCNVGPGYATAVTVTDAGGQSVTALDSDDERFLDGTFYIGNLDPDSCESLTVTADIDGNGHNIAYVDSPDDPLEEGANQPNESIEEDTDGWDRVDFEIPSETPGEIPGKTPGAAGPTPNKGNLAFTGPQVGGFIAGAIGLLVLGAGLVIGRKKL